MDTRSRIVATVLGCATFFGTALAFYNWGRDAGVQAADTSPERLKEQVLQLEDLKATQENVCNYDDEFIAAGILAE